MLLEMARHSETQPSWKFRRLNPVEKQLCQGVRPATAKHPPAEGFAALRDTPPGA